MIKGLELAIEQSGGNQSKLAKLLSANQKDKGRQPTNVRQQDVWRWLNKTGRVPAEIVLSIEEVTGVARHLVRPDIFPEPAEAA